VKEDSYAKIGKGFGRKGNDASLLTGCKPCSTQLNAGKKGPSKQHPSLGKHFAEARKKRIDFEVGRGKWQRYLRRGSRKKRVNKRRVPRLKA